MLKRRLALLLVVTATAFGGAAVSPVVHQSSFAPIAYAKSCSSSYVHASLSWGHKCLRRGQYCKIGADREYHPYRFHCHRSSGDRNGDFHLT